MRGLEIRCTLALSNMVSGFDKVTSNGLFDQAMAEANELGYKDAKKGVYEPPAMFNDSELLREWQRGQIESDVDYKIYQKEMA